MGKLYYLALVVALVVGLIVGSCISPMPVDSAGTVQIPVILYFPDNETAEMYEESFVENIVTASEQFDYVNFYVADVRVRDYDLDLTYGDTPLDQYFLHDDAISVFAVLSIQDATDERVSYGGIALVKSFCERFSAGVYPIEHPLLFAHELGHITGLQHSDTDMSNIMHPWSIYEDATFTEDQQLLAHQGADSWSFNCQ